MSVSDFQDQIMDMERRLQTMVQTLGSNDPAALCFERDDTKKGIQRNAFTDMPGASWPRIPHEVQSGKWRLLSGGSTFPGSSPVLLNQNSPSWTRIKTPNTLHGTATSRVVEAGFMPVNGPPWNC